MAISQCRRNEECWWPRRERTAPNMHKQVECGVLLFVLVSLKFQRLADSRILPPQHDSVQKYPAPITHHPPPITCDPQASTRYNIRARNYMLGFLFRQSSRIHTVEVSCRPVWGTKEQALKPGPRRAADFLRPIRGSSATQSRLVKPAMLLLLVGGQGCIIS